MKTFFKAAGIVLCSLLMALGAVGTASANSIPVHNVYDGTWSYDDGHDKICAHAYDSEGARIVRIHLIRLNKAGPSDFYVKDYNNYYNGTTNNTCSTKLATAYEDTYYKAVVYTYWGERGSWKYRETKYFYS